jgi:hypothetical protein
MTKITLELNMSFQILFRGFLAVYATLISLQIKFCLMDLSLMQTIQDSQILFTEPEGNTLQTLPTITSSKYITSYTLVQAYKQEK